jgi:hypothetical protein
MYVKHFIFRYDKDVATMLRVIREFLRIPDTVFSDQVDKYKDDGLYRNSSSLRQCFLLLLIDKIFSNGTILNVSFLQTKNIISHTLSIKAHVVFLCRAGDP